MWPILTKSGLLPINLQVLRCDLNFHMFLATNGSSYVHKIFRVFAPTSYSTPSIPFKVQHKVSRHIRITLTQLYQACISDGGSRWARVSLKPDGLGRCKGKPNLIMAYNWL